MLPPAPPFQCWALILTLEGGRLNGKYFASGPLGAGFNFEGGGGGARAFKTYNSQGEQNVHESTTVFHWQNTFRHLSDFCLVCSGSLVL